MLVELAHICLFHFTTECEYSLLHNLMHTRYIYCVVKTINGTHPNPSDKVFPRNVREIVGAMHLEIHLLIFKSTEEEYFYKSHDYQMYCCNTIVVKHLVSLFHRHSSVVLNEKRNRQM